jgi:SAM-dependent methyltransferase
MNAPNVGVEDRTAPNALAVPWQAARRQRPSFRISDLWRAPLHDFPIRDEVLYQCLPLSSDLNILEIGPGNGFSAFRMSREVSHVTLLDVSARSIRQLETQLGGIPNLSFVSDNLCIPGLKERITKEFDAIFGLAVVHLLSDPAIAFKNLSAVLSRNGRLVLQFPNYLPPRGTGITFFEKRLELDRLLQEAGFETWAVFAIGLRPHARFVFEQFHERPLQILQWLGSRKGKREPLSYQATWAFNHGRRLEPLKCPMHLAWTMLAGAIHAGGDAFEFVPLGQEILNNNLLLLARR